MNLQKIEQGIRLLLEGIGEDPDREGLKDTPRRVAEMCQEIFAGVNQQPELHVGFNDPDIQEDLVAITNIPFYSMCEHHLLPFFGKVHLFYFPKNHKVAGFSSLIKIVEVISRRPQIQERLTHQIAEAIMNALEPRGVLVLVEATQLCVAMRGLRKEAVQTVTQVVRGEVPLDAINITRYLRGNE
ncbi:MAG: GTP cyclohydrolase I FolE [Calditrichaeota bacterium]|nr:GTP cyclohydrolase I FolE [Calditrichota bacterium]